MLKETGVTTIQTLAQLRERVIWEMGRHCPFSPHFSQLIDEAPAPLRALLVEEPLFLTQLLKSRDGAPGEADILLESFKAFYKHQKAC